jgi:hypothetical protein
VDFVDRTVVELGDESTRAGVFDQGALEQLVECAYDTADMGVAGPFTADFADFRVGWAPGPLGSFEGTWNVVGAPERSEARFRLAGLPSNGLPRVDALWRGAIVGRFRLGGEPITEVATAIPDDETIETGVTFDEPEPVSDTVRPLPVAIALMVREALPVAGLLHDVGVVGERLGVLGIERPPDDRLRLRRPLVVCLVVPETVFDDDDWPGAAGGMTPAERRAARRSAAGAWLAREGIGLVVGS